MTTTVRLSQELKARIARAAEREGTTAHSFVIEAIKEKTTTLAQASMKLGEAMYAASQTNAGGDAPGGDAGPGDDASAKSNEDVVDADFEEVDDDKKKSA